MSTTEKILDAAEKRIRKSGYNAVSFRELAADTAIKSASVHYHFPRKEDLGIALVTRYSERFFEALESRAKSSNTAYDKLSAFCDVYRAALRADDTICLCGMLGAESPGLPEPLTTAVSAFFDANIDWVCEALADWGTQNERKKFAVNAVAGLQGAMMLATTLKQPALFEHVADGMLSKVRN